MNYYPLLPPIQGDCSICLESLTEERSVAHSGGGELHPVHRRCIKQWLKVKPICPTCKVSVNPEIDGKAIKSISLLQGVSVGLIAGSSITLLVAGGEHVPSEASLAMFASIEVSFGIFTVSEGLDNKINRQPLVHTIGLVTAVSTLAYMLNYRVSFPTIILANGAALMVLLSSKKVRNALYNKIISWFY